MGEAKRRKQAGRQQPARDTALTDKPRSSQEFFDQLAPAQRPDFFQLFEATREITRDELMAVRSEAADGRSEGLESLARARHADLDDAVEAGFAASPDGEATRRAIACRKGCYFCCHVNVSASIPDAILVANTIRSGSAGRFAAAVRTTAAQIAGLDPAERYRQAIPCPLLEDGACGIHEARPTACRAYLATDAGKCEASLSSVKAGGQPTPVESLAYPQQLSAAINSGVLQGCAEAGLQSCAVELTGAVDLILRDATAVDRWLNGEHVFAPYRAGDG
ncbi:MAG: YkgJ family cysteine cluster protein [Alphaproteobacteria bacterium]|nr:YkgJ family cysteine cluster protein [Alphaproteobacteria bacterium]